VGKIDLDEKKVAKPEESKQEKLAEKEEKQETEEPKEEPREVIEAKADALKGLTVVGKIELPKEKPVASSDDKPERKKKKRPRRRIAPSESKRSDNKGRGNKRSKIEKEDVSEKEIQEQIKATLAKLSGGKAM